MIKLRNCTALLALLLSTVEARAQLGEVQLGAKVSYGMPDAYGVGGGMVAGVAAGRLSYVGVRGVYQRGSTRRVNRDGEPVLVTDRVRVIAADLGLMIPVSGFELVPGASFGVMRLTQKSRALPADGEAAPGQRAQKFFVAPGVALHAHVAGLVIVPEIQACLAGTAQLPAHSPHRGFISTLRVVVPIEVGRIRH